MPAIDFIKNQDILQLVVWDLQEDPKELELLFGLENNNDYKNLTEKRKREFLGKKLCLDFLGIKEKIKYKENGKPFLENSGEISISHSESKICVAISSKTVGIDIEKYKPEKIKSLQKKFVSALEEKWLTKKENHATYLHLIWGAKEALYKISTTSGLVWKHNMQIDEFAYQEKDENSFDCWMIEMSKFTKYQANYKTIGEYFLVWIVCSG